MNTCEVCHTETRNRKRVGKHKELLCSNCRQSVAYYESLTPEEWAAEQASMADYITDHERETY